MQHKDLLKKGMIGEVGGNHGEQNIFAANSFDKVCRMLRITAVLRA